MFQVAIERLAREVAVEKTDYFQSTEKIENILNSNVVIAKNKNLS